MANIFIFILGGVIGALVGATCLLIIIQSKEDLAEDQKLKRMNRAEWFKKKKDSKTENKNPYQKIKKKGLKDRLKKGESWTDFKCGLYGTDTKKYISLSRRNEDKAYSYIKSKKKEEES